MLSISNPKFNFYTKSVDSAMDSEVEQLEAQPFIEQEDRKSKAAEFTSVYVPDIPVNSPDNANQTEMRIYHLDGIRGMGAFMVVQSHMWIEGSPQICWLKNIVTETPLQVLLDGQIAVAIFFVLSGYVLSLPFFKIAKRRMKHPLSGNPVDNPILSRVPQFAISRFFRLAIPSFASLLITYLSVVLMYWRLHCSSEWTPFLNHAPQPFLQLFKDCWGLFPKGGAALSPVLWSIPVQLQGSYLVVLLTVVLIPMHWKRRWLVYLLWWYLNKESKMLGHYTGFVLGVFMADLETSTGYLPWLLRRQQSDRIQCAFLSGALFIGLLILSIGDHFHQNAFHRSIVAFFIVATANGSILLRAIYGSRIMKFFGDISFSIYLLHMPVYYLTGPLIKQFMHETMGISVCATNLIFWLFVYMVILIPICTLFWWGVESRTSAWSKRISRFIFFSTENGQKQSKNSKSRS